MAKKFKVNSASHVAAIPFKEGAGSWSKAAPKTTGERRELAKQKGGWKHVGLIYDEEEDRIKYPFVDKNGTPRIDGLMAAWKRANQVAKSGRGDATDAQEAKEVIRLIKNVAKRWKNSKSQIKKEFAQAILESEAREAAAPPSRTPEVFRWVDEVLERVMKKKRPKNGVTVARRESREAARPDPRLRQLKLLLEVASLTPYTKVSPEKYFVSTPVRTKVERGKVAFEAEAVASDVSKAVKHLYTSLKDVPGFKYARTPKEFYTHLKEVKTLLKSEEFRAYL